MDNYTLMPMYGYRIKPVGIFLSLVAVTLLFFTERICQLPLLQGYTQRDCGILLMCLNGIALYFIAFSKERNEDERIAIIRDKTFRLSFSVIFSALIVVPITQMIFMKGYTGDKLITISSAYLMFMLLINLGLITQIIVFYFRILTNSDTASFDFTVLENIKNNKKIYLLYFALYLAGIIALLIF